MLFVYGTLLFAEVLRAVLGRVPAMEAATLPGWRAAALPGRVYPGLVPVAPAPAPGSVTGSAPAPVGAPAGAGAGATGQVLSGLTAGEWAILDDFEGDEYVRRECTLGDGRTAWAYIWRAPHRVAGHDWDPARFAAVELPDYVDGCSEWREAIS